MIDFAIIPGAFGATSLQLSAGALFIFLLSALFFIYNPDPCHVKRIPSIRRSRILDAYSTGVYWRLIVPRLFPYLREAYYEYSKNDKPFKVWIAAFQDWIYMLPPKYLTQIKNQDLSELSLRDLIDKFLSPKFSTGHFDTFQVQVASKLVNRNLVDIKPLVQVRTEEALANEIGEPKQWKRFNAQRLSTQIVKHVSGRVTFGANLADNASFLDAMERFTSKIGYYSLIARWINIPFLRETIMYLLQTGHRRDLAVATRYITDEIAQRYQMQKDLPEDERPVDCIQWAMDQDLPNELKTPEIIAHRLLHISAGIIETPITVLVNLMYDTISHSEFIDEVRREILQCLDESNGIWNETSMTKMKKFDSFMRESMRLTPGLAPFTGMRIVTCDRFRFDDTLVFPKGTAIGFPAICMQRDSEFYPDPEKFNGLRFYRMKDEDPKAVSESYIADIRNGWLSFGYGRQACPGRFYAIRLLKTVLGEMILRFDMRYAGGERSRPEPLDLEPTLIADTTVDLEFRCRP